MNLVEEKIQNLFTEILLSTSQVPLLPWDLFKPTQLVITHRSELKNMIVFSTTCFLFFFKWIDMFIYLFLAVLGLPFCVRAFSNCGKWGPLFIAVRGPLTYRGLSCCGAQAPDAQAQ